MPKYILEQSKKIKDYLNKIKKAVETTIKAREYSIYFFALKLLMYFFNSLPKRAQTHIDGKQITAAVIVTNKIPTMIFSSVGKIQMQQQ